MKPLFTSVAIVMHAQFNILQFSLKCKQEVGVDKIGAGKNSVVKEIKIVRPRFSAS
jgi:hypothetical protein